VRRAEAATRTRWNTRTEGEHGAGGGERVAGSECSSACRSLREGEEKDTRGEATANAVEEQVEVADGGEEECRVFTQGSHMSGDGRAAAGEGEEEAGFARFSGSEMEGSTHDCTRRLGRCCGFLARSRFGLPIFGSPVWNSKVTARFTL
jgi:hypothetical protein